MQKNQNSKSNHGKGKPAPSGAFTHRIREDGEIFSAIDLFVRHRKKARDASPPPQDDLWVVVKNLSQQVAAQQAELDALRNAFALQQKTSAELVDQMKSTGEATQAALAAILADWKSDPLFPKP
ncbi:hypothetical protein BASA60_001025 [Batrachochytrium salamandrivorans]|nr:hypothetical protein BASA60_001025 [Batrachochytrium salamandrivorans]